MKGFTFLFFICMHISVGYVTTVSQFSARVSNLDGPGISEIGKIESMDDKSIAQILNRFEIFAKTVSKYQPSSDWITLLKEINIIFSKYDELLVKTRQNERLIEIPFRNAIMISEQVLSTLASNEQDKWVLYNKEPVSQLETKESQESFITGAKVLRLALQAYTWILARSDGAGERDTLEKFRYSVESLSTLQSQMVKSPSGLKSMIFELQDLITECFRLLSLRH